MTRIPNGRSTGIEAKNTGEEEKLLSFIFAPGGALEHAEAGLSGARDGKWRGKFRRIYAQDRNATHRLSAPGAGCEFRGPRRGQMLEAIAAKPARRDEGGVELQRHRPSFMHTPPRQGKPEFAKGFPTGRVAVGRDGR